MSKEIVVVFNGKIDTQVYDMKIHLLHFYQMAELLREWDGLGEKLNLLSFAAFKLSISDKQKSGLTVIQSTFLKSKIQP